MMRSGNLEKVDHLLGMGGGGGFEKAVQLSGAVTSKYTLGFIRKFFCRSYLNSSCFRFRLFPF